MSQRCHVIPIDPEIRCVDALRREVRQVVAGVRSAGVPGPYVLRCRPEQARVLAEIATEMDEVSVTAG